MVKATTKKRPAKKPSRSSTHLAKQGLIRHNLDLKIQATERLDEMAPRFQQKERKPFIERIVHGLLDRPDCEALINAFLFPTKSTSNEKES